MRTRNHGKYTNMSRNRPQAIGTSDRSGFLTKKATMKRQFRYSGTGKIDLGILVDPSELDKLNPQDLAPIVKPDPIPIRNARPDSVVNAQTTLETSVGVLTIDVSGSSNITLTNEEFSNGSFNFKGVLLGDVIVYVPNIFKQFYANNLTIGVFNLGMQLIGSLLPPLLIPSASPVTNMGPLVGNTVDKLQFVYF